MYVGICQRLNKGRSVTVTFGQRPEGSNERSRQKKHQSLEVEARWASPGRPRTLVWLARVSKPGSQRLPSEAGPALISPGGH